MISKKLIAFTLSLFLLLSACASCNTKLTTNGYDAELATQLGADEYGMRSYVLLFLKQVPL